MRRQKLLNNLDLVLDILVAIFMVFIILMLMGVITCAVIAWFKVW